MMDIIPRKFLREIACMCTFAMGPRIVTDQPGSTKRRGRFKGRKIGQHYQILAHLRSGLRIY